MKPEKTSETTITLPILITLPLAAALGVFYEQGTRWFHWSILSLQVFALPLLIALGMTLWLCWRRPQNIDKALGMRVVLWVICVIAMTISSWIASQQPVHDPYCSPCLSDDVFLVPMLIMSYGINLAVGIVVAILASLLTRGLLGLFQPRTPRVTGF